MTTLGRQWDDGGTRSEKFLTSEIIPPAKVKKHQRAVGMFTLSGADFPNAPLQQVEVKKLKPTQQFLWKHQYESIAKAPGELPPVHVAHKDGQHYLIDGHHRWERARQEGRTTIQARVINL